MIQRKKDLRVKLQYLKEMVLDLLLYYFDLVLVVGSEIA